ncbi:MAG: hypothetical protein KGI71_04840 [Patescibacteria group bacterium]|nr:hypothetical protein [Patescibacteria group bacterium]
MKLCAALALVLAGCNSCQPAAAPSDQSVYETLVDAGCMAPDPEGGVQAVALDHQIGDHPWLQCLYDGGTVKSCGVPCK